MKKILDHNGNVIETEQPKTKALVSKSKKFIVGLAALLAFAAGVAANYKTLYEIIFPSSKVSYALTIDTVRDNSSGGPRVAISEEDNINYKEFSVDGNKKIYKPDMPFMEKKNDAIYYVDSRISVVQWELAFPFPALDIKVANNTKEVLFYSSAVIKIKKVTADNSPLIYEQWNGFGGMVNLYNTGWGAAKNVSVNLLVTPNKEKHKEDPVTIKKTIGDIASDAMASFDLNKELCNNQSKIKIFGSRVSIPCNSVEKYGKVVKVEGDVAYCGEDGAQYHTTLSFFRPLISMPLGPVPPSYTYDIEFKYDEGPVEKKLEISQEIKSGHTDRFRIVILPDRSATYECDLSLMSIQEETHTFSFVLKVFRPRIDIKHNKAN